MTERLHFHFSLSCIGEGNGNPLQCSCLENPRDGGAWWAAVYGVSQNRTLLKRLSSSSSSSMYISIPLFQIILSYHLSPSNFNFVFYICNSISDKIICTLFLYSTYKQYYIMFVFLCLTDLYSV